MKRNTMNRFFRSALAISGTTLAMGGMSCQQATELFNTGFEIGQNIAGGMESTPTEEYAGDEWYGDESYIDPWGFEPF